MKFALLAKLGGFLALAVAVVFLLFFWLGKDSAEQNVPAPVSPQSTQRKGSPPESSIGKPIRVGQARRTRPTIQGAFTPQEVIGNRDCLFQAGRGNAAGLGLVALLNESGARFEVLDGEGRVLGGTLPFVPNHYRIARHADGSVLTAFGDLRLNSLAFRPEETSEPVRIFRDGGMIFETDKAWDFGLSPDGSAFYVVEPTSGHASRLLIRNLDQGTEYQHDLGYEYTAVHNELPYGLRFTANGSEVMMVPSIMSGGKSHIFFPADGGNRRQITLEGRGAVVFESMHHGYYAFPQSKNEPWLIQKKELRWDAPDHAPATKDIWSREISLEHFYGDISLSNDTAWLILDSWVIYILDAKTGATTFAWPHARPYDEEQLARLSTVLTPEATIADIGGVGQVDIVDDQLRLYRRIYRSPTRPSYFFDVFDMTSIALDSKPKFRVAVSRSNSCQAGDFSLRGLQIVDGTLTYLTQERGSDNSPTAPRS